MNKGNISDLPELALAILAFAAASACITTAYFWNNGKNILTGNQKNFFLALVILSLVLTVVILAYFLLSLFFKFGDRYIKNHTIYVLLSILVFMLPAVLMSVGVFYILFESDFKKQSIVDNTKKTTTTSSSTNATPAENSHRNKQLILASLILFLISAISSGMGILFRSFKLLNV